MHPLFFSSILTLSYIGSYPTSLGNNDGSSSQSYVPINSKTYDRSHCPHSWDLWCNAQLDYSRRIELETVARLMPKNFIFCLLDVEINLPMLNTGLIGSESRSSVQSRFSCTEDVCGEKILMQERIDELASYKSLGLHVDTAVFASSAMQLKPDFVELVTTTYRSPLSRVDFDGAPSRGRIISFLKEKTINYLHDPPIFIQADEYTSLAVSNVVEFKRKWLNKFDVAKTSPKRFTDALGSQHSVPTMYLDARIRHGVAINLSYVELPYEDEENSNIKMSMFCLVPPAKGAPIVFNGNFKNLFLSDLEANGKYDEALVELPKFRIESNINVKQVVDDNMQYGLWPPNRSNFAGITDSPYLYLEKYFQKTVISVDEEGTVITTTDLPTTENYDDSKPFTDESFYVLIGITAPVQRIIYFGRVSA